MMIVAPDILAVVIFADGHMSYQITLV